MMRLQWSQSQAHYREGVMWRKHAKTCFILFHFDLESKSPQPSFQASRGINIPKIVRGPIRWF